jgi:hypothetical protein
MSPGLQAPDDPKRRSIARRSTLTAIASVLGLLLIGAACSSGTTSASPTRPSSAPPSGTSCVANGTISPDSGAPVTFTNVEATRTDDGSKITYFTRTADSTAYLSVSAPVGHPDQVDGSISGPTPAGVVAIQLGHFADGMPPYTVSEQGAEIETGGGGPTDPYAHPAVTMRITCS